MTSSPTSSCTRYNCSTFSTTAPADKSSPPCGRQCVAITRGVCIHTPPCKMHSVYIHVTYLGILQGGVCVCVYDRLRVMAGGQQLPRSVPMRDHRRKSPGLQAFSMISMIYMQAPLPAGYACSLYGLSHREGCVWVSWETPRADAPGVPLLCDDPGTSSASRALACIVLTLG